MKIASKLAALAVIVAGSSAYAIGPVGPGTYSASLPLTLLTTSGSLELPAYDAATYGPLTSVTLKLVAHVEGNVKYESLDAGPSVVNITVGGVATLSKPGGGVIVTSLPVFNDTQPVSAYDGITDYLGTSGNTFTGLVANDTQTGAVLPADFGLFLNPPSSIFIPYSFSSSSGATGPGNIQTIISTMGSVDAFVTYTSVPEPTMALAFAPAALLLGRRRRA